MPVPRKALTKLHFNSIKVRLELGNDYAAFTKEIYFNSIKVRLEPDMGRAVEGIVLLFQFHKGTIRTTTSLDEYKAFAISIP